MERNSNPTSRGSQNTNIVATSPVEMVKDIALLALSHWKWFVLSLLITLGLATWKILRTPKTYTYSTSILIKSNQHVTPAEQELQKLGIGQTSTDMTNELLSFKSSVLAQDIVERLNLDVNYLREGKFHQVVAYGLNLPVYVRFLTLNDNESASMNLTLQADQKVRIADLKKNGSAQDNSYLFNLGDTVQTSIGQLVVVASPFYQQGQTDQLIVQRISKPSAISMVRGRIAANLRNQNASIIDITYRDVSTSRAEDILNTLVAVYNENWVKERNRMSVSTSSFIKERLDVIEQELGMVDENISQYKSSHLMTDVSAMGSAAMSQAQSAEQQTREIDNRMYITRYIRDHLMDSQNDNQLLPANSGLGNSNLESQIKDYNETLLKRNKYLANSSANNPLVKQLEQDLDEMKQNIVGTLDNDMEILRAAQQTTQATQSKANARIAANPRQQQHLLSIERQQKVKESLYLFLLQKREENELSQAFTAYNTKLIEPPHPSGAPAEPIDSNILMSAFIIGLIIPVGIIALREISNTRIRSRKDLQKLSLPFIGEIPQTGPRKKRKKKGEKPLSTIVVKEKNRDFINEAFRVVRSNLEFALGYDTDKHVIMMTGIDVGAGKTFLSLNLANVLGLKGKKVILLDLDLRKASLSESVNLKGEGMSNYLIGQVTDYHQLIQHQDHIDILPCGTLPPNPTELLYSIRLKQLIEELHSQYDYVIIDCPPVEIIADAAIINQYVDMTLFVIRTEVTDRSILNELEQWYQEKRYKGLAVILNGSYDSMGRYGYHRYGYHRYGYHNYGYHTYGAN